MERATMHRLILSLATACLVTVFCSSTQAESPVWKISKGDSYFYLGGTVHLLSESDHPLPNAFDQAYSDADALFFETDIRASKTVELQQKLMQALMLPSNTQLADTLSKKSLAELNTFLASRDLAYQSFAQFSAGGAGLILSVMEYQRLGLSPEWGIDQVMFERASKDRKTIFELESPEQQIRFITSMTQVEANKAISHALMEIDKLPEIFSELKQAWLTGDLNALNDMALKDLKADFPQVYDALIHSRNNNWMEILIKLNDTRDIEFVLVGALHLPGSNGLIEQLKRQGYKVKQM